MDGGGDRAVGAPGVVLQFPHNRRIYLPMLRQPIVVYAADAAGIRRAYDRAMAREVEQLSIFTLDLFSTPHDTANRAAVAAVPADELDLVGAALRDERKIVDKVLDKLRPHP